MFALVALYGMGTVAGWLSGDGDIVNVACTSCDLEILLGTPIVTAWCARQDVESLGDGALVDIVERLRGFGAKPARRCRVRGKCFSFFLFFADVVLTLQWFNKPSQSLFRILRFCLFLLGLRLIVSIVLIIFVSAGAARRFNACAFAAGRRTGSDCGPIVLTHRGLVIGGGGDASINRREYCTSIRGRLSLFNYGMPREGWRDIWECVELIR